MPLTWTHTHVHDLICSTIHCMPLTWSHTHVHDLLSITYLSAFIHIKMCMTKRCRLVFTRYINETWKTLLRVSKRIPIVQGRCTSNERIQVGKLYSAVDESFIPFVRINLKVTHVQRFISVISPCTLIR